jgi:hypothetical protein
MYIQDFGLLFSPRYLSRTGRPSLDEQPRLCLTP